MSRDGQTSLVMDTSKLRKTVLDLYGWHFIYLKAVIRLFQRGPRTKPYGSKLGKDVDRQKMISQKRDRSKKKSASEKDPNEAYKCVPCNKVFHKKNYLRKHDNRFHRVKSFHNCILWKQIKNFKPWLKGGKKLRKVWQNVPVSARL